MQIHRLMGLALLIPYSEQPGILRKSLAKGWIPSMTLSWSCFQPRTLLENPPPSSKSFRYKVGKNNSVSNMGLSLEPGTEIFQTIELFQGHLMHVIPRVWAVPQTWYRHFHLLPL